MSSFIDILDGDKHPSENPTSPLSGADEGVFSVAFVLEEVLAWALLLRLLSRAVAIVGDELVRDTMAYMLEKAYVDFNYKDALLSLDGQRAETVLDTLQGWLDVVPTDHFCYRRGIYLLIGLAGNSGRLPPSLFLTDINIGGHRDPTVMGGHADIFQGWYNGRLVAVKRPRCISPDRDPGIYKELCKEALVWRQLHHPHVLPFLGLDCQTFSEMRFTCIVLPWVGKGTLSSYIHTSEYNVKDRHRLLVEVADGLRYIHSLKVAHRDIHGGNILISNDDHALIADFGISTIGDETSTRILSENAGAGAARWMSPERLDPAAPKCKARTASDVWAFGCLCVMVYTRKAPYSKIRNDFAVVTHILGGGSPTRPTKKQCDGLPMQDEIWDIVKPCWERDINSRPTMQRVYEQLLAFKWVPKITVVGIVTNSMSVTDFAMSPAITSLSSKFRSLGQSDESSKPSRSSRLISTIFARQTLDSTSLDLPPISDTSDAAALITLRGNSSKEGLRDIEVRLCHLLSSKTEKEAALRMARSDFGQILIEVLYWISTEIAPNRPRLRARQAQIRQFVIDAGLCGDKFPRSFYITDLYKSGLHAQTFSSGLSADIIMEEHQGRRVVVKSLMVLPSDNLNDIRKRYCFETLMCKQLNHPRLISILGVIATSDPGKMCIVLPWSKNGNIVEYQLAQGPDKVDPVPMLVQAAEGLSWLHQQHVIHGNIGGRNILVDEDGGIRIAGFGNAIIDCAENKLSAGRRPAQQWMAPELFASIFDHRWEPTTKSDVYSFAHTMVEMYTLRSPYFHLSQPEAVTKAILQGECPERPISRLCYGRTIPEDLWALIILCRCRDKTKRPDMTFVLEELSGIAEI